MVKVSYFGNKDSRLHPFTEDARTDPLRVHVVPSEAPYEGTSAKCRGGVFICQVFREGCSCVSTAMTNRLEIRVLA